MSNNRSERALGNLRQRKNFARIPTVIGIPNLIEIQKKSFEYFLQWDVAPHDRQKRGLEDVFSDCLLYTSPSPRDRTRSRMPSSA